MGNANELLQEYIEKNKISVIKISRDLDVSPARVYQWLDGEVIPHSRIRFWSLDPERPTYIRELAKKILNDESHPSDQVQTG